DYVLVPAGLEEPFAQACRAAAAALYPTFEENADYTNIISDPHRERLRRMLDDARDRGARVVPLHPAAETFEGSRKFPPALVLGVTEEMALTKEEIFGPILPIVPYPTLTDAIAHVNDRPRPLALYYFGHDRRAIDRVLAETIAGGVTVNETLLHLMQDDLPFGGVGPSGMGHYHGREGFEAFTKKKPVFQQSRLHARRLLRPPYGKVAAAFLRALLR
ncbi:MAG: aldehyde dehydrogenase family protein, partial [Myxococcales bacterium]|nr:aldehyde dehydrogenase family protein [Myxococcales bacterium]